jgi:hypothetical protein
MGFATIADVAKPRDQTHCQYCRKEMQEGDFCMSSCSPINKRRPFQYRSRVAHFECYERHMAAFWVRKRGKS